MNVADGVFAGFGSVFFTDYEPGRVSMVSQSGGFGFSVMNLSSKDGGLPFRQMVTTGNEIGVSTLDFIDYFIRDPKTDIIAGYLEGAKDAWRLPEIGQKALAAGKPILMWKVGNTEQGQKAAASHTANLGGAMALYKAAFRQNGIIQVEDIQDVVDYGRAFRSGRLPQGNRLAIITISGGAGILMTDECIGRGMRLADLAPETVAKLREFVPSFGSINNPVDVTAAIFNDLTLINRTLQAIVDDPGVDCIAMINASLQGEIASEDRGRDRGGRRQDRQADLHRVERARRDGAGSLRRARGRAHPALQVAGALRARAGGGVVVRRGEAPAGASGARRSRWCSSSAGARQALEGKTADVAEYAREADAGRIRHPGDAGGAGDDEGRRRSRSRSASATRSRSRCSRPTSRTRPKRARYGSISHPTESWRRRTRKCLRTRALTRRTHGSRACWCRKW